ncbi:MULTISPECIES: restriction endonuclease, SacI family [unclassified Bradyrhizobium]
MVIDKKRAKELLLEEAARASSGYIDRTWQAEAEALSELAKRYRTHVAAVATATLAKCVDQKVDVFSLKASSGEFGYSARSLAKEVLAPMAREIGVNWGATGPEPLNNVPYVGKVRISRDWPVKGGAVAALNKVCDILDRLQAVKDETQARAALRAFIFVRRQHGKQYSAMVDATLDVAIDQLCEAVQHYVAENSEGGFRAQAVVAALMDLMVGADRTSTKRINDPSRTVPGDVVVTRVDMSGIERVLEVRDKVVKHDDLLILATRAAEKGVSDAIMVAVAGGQPDIRFNEAQAWAAQKGVALTLFQDWTTLIRQVLLWSSTPTLEGARQFPQIMYERLIAMEASEEAVETWAKRFQKD